jgi:hypothetical protein
MKIADLTGMTEKRDGAYEIKFLVPIDVGERALAWARIHLAPDPHVDTSHGDGYSVNSLYFDTPSLDVYQRNGSYGKSKYRVRRYGQEELIFLERKLKSRGLVSKRRTKVPDREILHLANGNAAPDWAGYWFRRRLLARQLQPKCQIRYERVARVGETPEGTVRFTLDHNVRAFQTDEYGVAENGGWMLLLPDHCILELKFRGEMPPLFKSLVDQLQLTPQSVSKYRLSIKAFGLDSSVKNAAGLEGSSAAAAVPEGPATGLSGRAVDPAALAKEA